MLQSASQRHVVWCIYMYIDQEDEELKFELKRSEGLLAQKKMEKEKSN